MADPVSATDVGARTRRHSRRAVLAGGALVTSVAVVGGPALFGAACTGPGNGSKPPAGSSPTVTPVPPETTPLPSTTPSPTAGPAAVASLLVPAPAVEERAFAPGEPIDWRSGIFFMNTRDGSVRGYTPGVSQGAQVSPGGRLFAQVNTGTWTDGWIYDRDQHRGWAWGRDTQLFFGGWSERHILFGRNQPGEPARPAGEYEVVDARTFQAVARFKMQTSPWPRQAIFAPDGSCLIAWSDPQEGPLRLCRVALPGGRVEVIYEAPPWPSGTAATPGTLVPVRGSDCFEASVYYPGVPEPVVRFRWDGSRDPAGAKELPTPGTGFSTSPGGQYSLFEETLHEELYKEADSYWERWPAVVAWDNAAGRALFRIRSAGFLYGDWLPNDRWLADGSGFVATVDDGSVSGTGWNRQGYGVFSMAGALTRLPSPPGGKGRWFELRRYSGPLPAPDNPNLFSFGRTSLYDRRRDTWFVASLANDDGPVHLDPWATGKSDEMVFATPHGGHGGGSPPALVGPAVEYPPFSDSLRFAVARTGTCLNVREGPGANSAVVTCLPDGARLTLDAVPGRFSVENNEDGAWIRVRTETGHSGWVSNVYLDWAL